VSRQALGKGLKALISDDSFFKQERLAYIDIERIKRNPHQPRTNFDEDNLNELADSIKQNGVLQPIIVVKNENDTFTLVVGERRLRASKIAGLKKIPSVIKKLSKKDLIGLSVLENVQREELNPIEISEALYKMNKNMNIDQNHISKILGINRASVSNYIRLNNLTQKSKNALLDEKITMGHAKVLLQLDTKEEELAFLNKIIKEKLSVRQLEKFIKDKKKTKIKQRKKQNDLYLKSLEEDLKSFIGFPVKIKINKRGGGELKIKYKNKEQFEHLIKFFKE